MLGNGGGEHVSGSNGRLLNELTLIARVCVYVNGKAAGTIEAFGTVRASVSSPAVRLLVGRDWGEAIVCTEFTRSL